MTMGIKVFQFAAMLAVVVSFNGVAGLQCWQCINLETDTSESLLSGTLSSKSDPNCINPSSYSVKQVTCPDDGSYKCSYIETAVKASWPIVGSVSIKANVRDCMPTGASNGCHGTEIDGVVSKVNEVLKIVTELSNVEITDTDACFCDTDLCDPKCKLFKISNFCVEWWMLAVGGGLALLVLTCCCCCCCCCCKCCRSSPQGQVITQPYAVPVPLIIQTTGPAGEMRNDIHGMSNPMYSPVSGGQMDPKMGQHPY